MTSKVRATVEDGVPLPSSRRSKEVRRIRAAARAASRRRRKDGRGERLHIPSLPRPASGPVHPEGLMIRETIG